MAPAPPRQVLEWLNGQDTVTLHLSTITIAEISYGLWILPDGKRRRSLVERFERFLTEGFEQRVLGFDLPAARLYGEIMSHRRAAGRPMSALDGQIASIARARGLAVATRNVKDFEECGLEVIDPCQPATIPLPG
ncbi:MAG: type II toxin-antitoxin system VapC family toxin [bacterium]